jgi:hypothetical protein
MERDRPQRQEPMRKMTIAMMKSGFLPYMSESFPYSGVVAVEVTRKDVTTQER